MLVEGFSTPEKRADQVVLEANTTYWDRTRFPQLKRIVFDNTLSRKDAIELVKTSEGRVDVVTDLSPLDTLRVAQSPFGAVVKNREVLASTFGFFNMRKANSPWQDIRMRQAVNYAINRADLIRYGAKGNGDVIPALVPQHGFGYNADLAPYPYDPVKARTLLREAGYADGLSVTMLATEDLTTQATVVSKMLEQAGLAVTLQMLDPGTYNRYTLIGTLEQPPEQLTWDIALVSWLDILNSPVLQIYHYYAVDGPYDWLTEAPALRQLYDQVLHTVEQERQQQRIGQMERLTHEQAYFLFLYNPIQLYAVNKAVKFVPYVTGHLTLAETSVTNQHWSIRKQKASMQEN